MTLVKMTTIFLFIYYNNLQFIDNSRLFSTLEVKSMIEMGVYGHFKQMW